MRLTRAAFSILLACAAFAHARADQPEAPVVPPPDAGRIHAYADDNPSCREWTDGCTICIKPESGEPHCSTPGIACEPAAIQCKKKAP